MTHNSIAGAAATIEQTSAPLMTTEQLAERWQLSPGHLANQRCLGGGPKFIRLGKAVRYRLADVLAYEETGR